MLPMPFRQPIPVFCILKSYWSLHVIEKPVYVRLTMLVAKFRQTRESRTKPSLSVALFAVQSDGSDYLVAIPDGIAIGQQSRIRYTDQYLEE